MLLSEPDEDYITVALAKENKHINKVFIYAKSYKHMWTT